MLDEMKAFFVVSGAFCVLSQLTLVCVKLVVALGGGWYVVAVTAEERGEGGGGIGRGQDVKMWEREGKVGCVCVSVCVNVLEYTQT